MEIIQFENNEFNLNVILDKEKNIFFKGKEVATILGYQDTNQAIRNHVDEEDKTTLEKLNPVETTGLKWKR